MLDVIQVKGQFFLGIVHVGGIAKANLSPSGQTGFDQMAAIPMRNLFDQFLLKFRSLGTGTDYGHLSLDDIPKLGDFIDSPFAQEFPAPSDPLVFLPRPFGSFFFGIPFHCPEFVKGIGASHETGPRLFEKERKAGIDGNNDKYGQDKRKGEQKPEDRQH